MNLFFRILLTIYAFCLTILSFLGILLSFRLNILGEKISYFNEVVLLKSNAQLITFIVAFIFFVLSITFLFSGFKSSKDKRAVSKYTNIGEVRISLSSIENIALAASRRLNGVRDTKAYVINNLNDSVAITIKAVVLPDINIPALSEDIQVKVKSLVEESSGVRVSDVRVIIDNIYTGYKARVE